MATDATGTSSTNYLIPKYLTSADAPSGKGLNAIVDYLDNLLKTGFVEKPSGIVSGEVPVWNGTGWDRSTTTKIGFESIKVPYAIVRHSVNQSIPNSTFQTLAFDTEDSDTDTMHDPVTNNSRITFKTAGVYLIGYNIDFGPSAAGTFREVLIQINGSINITDETKATSTAEPVGNGSALFVASANDYATLVVFQNSGAAINVVGGVSYSPRFWAIRMG